MRVPSVAFLSKRAGALISAILVFLLLVLGGEVVLRAQSEEQASKRHVETLSYATTLRVRLERELNSLLSLSNGLSAYLVVRNDSLKASEINDILSVLHRSSRHVRNFAVAVGFRVRYIQPLQGNEKAIGLYYPNLPTQWPLVEKMAKTGEATLAGPVNLVQGGNGLIFRVPLFIDKRYWGLLSTVIDSDSLFKAVAAEALDERYEFAVRGRDGKGVAGEQVWGSMSLFEQPGVLIQEMEVPGGRWAIAVKASNDKDRWLLRWAFRAGLAIVAFLIASMLYFLIRNRGLMAHRAMYDGLTGLPNRRLFEDRALMAFSRHQRQPVELCALLFLDLDDFKDINDKHGHKAGDAVLQAVADRALAAVRQNDTVARWGGDEFIVLLEKISRAMLDTVSQRLRQAVEEAIEFEGLKLRVGVSIGVALYPEGGAELDELLRMADEDMYREKSLRKAEF